MSERVGQSGYAVVGPSSGNLQAGRVVTVYLNQTSKAMSKKSHHVVPNPDGGWNVKKGGATRASKHFNTKSQAISYGRKVSQNQRSEFVIHKRDGTIQRKDSHGNDPLPPRDTK